MRSASREIGFRSKKRWVSIPMSGESGSSSRRSEKVSRRRSGISQDAGGLFGVTGDSLKGGSHIRYVSITLRNKIQSARDAGRKIKNERKKDDEENEMCLLWIRGGCQSGVGGIPSRGSWRICDGSDSMSKMPRRKISDGNTTH